MSAYCEVIGQRLGLTPRACAQLRLAATMHDVGKVAIPDAILHKPGPLTDEERAVMQRHAEEGHEMLAGSGVDTLQLAAVIALHHHERHDGAGYPHGLAGEAIPLPARIAAVADVFDALTSDRVYRPALALEEALELIRAGRGSQFDPEVVDAFFAGLADVERIRAELSPTAADAASSSRALVSAA
jgi:putative two-component system response regulator